MSVAATSLTGASFKLLRSFNEDCSLQWLETEADATPATKRAKAAIFMLSAWVKKKQILNGKTLVTATVSANNWKQNNTAW